jgi:hypothetical protein
MERIDCRMGHTQIGKIFAHARRETQILKVQALVFVGDAIEEDPDALSHDAAELGRLGVPAFMFQEGHDREVERVFREIARLTHGAYCRFNPGKAHVEAMESWIGGGGAPAAGRAISGCSK